MNKNMIVLVTGGAGFIGSNLCEVLLKEGYRVVCLDNFSTGKKLNIKPLLSNKNFELIEGDIRNLDDCLTATKNVDFVLHHAALGSVPRSIKDPITTNQVNIDGFLNMLKASNDNNVKRFVYAASSSTYGDSKTLPKVEDKIGLPLSPYALTKFVNELYADVFNKTYGLETIGFRYFNVFGRKQDPNGAYAAVIPLFIKQLMNKETVTINGDGNFSRDFTYVDNVIQANLLAIKTTNKEAVNNIYNIAYGERTTLNELAKILKGYLSKYDASIGDVPIEHRPERTGDIPHSLASIDKAEKYLGYKPLFSVKKGLQVAVEWYFKNQ